MSDFEKNAPWNRRFDGTALAYEKEVERFFEEMTAGRTLEEKRANPWNVEILQYLHSQGLQLIPLNYKGKESRIPDWPNLHLGLGELEEDAFRRGWGMAILPHGDFCFIDVDSDHNSGADGMSQFKAMHMPKTVYCYKQNSRNIHAFYRMPEHLGIRLTGQQAPAPGLELASEKSHCRVTGDYHFNNLDITKPWLDQLAPLPEGIFQSLKEIKRRQALPKYVPTFRGKGSGSPARYLAKCDVPGDGEHQSGYARLMFLMVVKNHMDYSDCVKAITEWDRDEGDNYQRSEPDQWRHAIRDPRKK